MVTVSFMNKKGGTGKTTTLVNTARILSDKGYRVLVVDLDQQGNAGIGVFNIETENENTSLEVIKGDAQIEEAIKRSFTLPEYEMDFNGDPVVVDGVPLVRIDSEDRGIDVVPADNAMSELSLTGGAIPGIQMRLKAALVDIADRYDYCLLDCPPSLGFETTIALTASDFVIIPTEADYFSSQGFISMVEVVGDVRKWYNPATTILGILITQYDARTRFAKEVAIELEKYAEKLGTFVYETRIRSTVRVKEAHNKGLTVVEYAPESTTAKDYMSFVDEMLAAIERVGADNV